MIRAKASMLPANAHEDGSTRRCSLAVSGETAVGFQTPLAGTRVFFAGEEGQLTYSSSNQVNALAPTDSLLEASAVYLTASAEDAKAIERLGRVATTLEGGAWEADGWTEPLRGKTVAVIDPDGTFSHLALKALRSVAKQAFVVDLLADSVTAWIAQGGERNALMRLTSEAVRRFQGLEVAGAPAAFQAVRPSV